MVFKWGVCLLGLVCSVSYELSKNEEFCVFLHLDEPTDYIMSFVLSGQGDKNAEVELKDPKGRVAYKKKLQQREGNHRGHAAELGKYSLCFKSLGKYKRTVTFDFNMVRDAPREFAPGDSFDPLIERLSEVVDRITTVYLNLVYYKSRERIHRDILEETCDLILWGCLLKILLIVALCVIQLFVLTGFFKNQKGTGI